jgi:hypothetical protein
VSIIGYDTLASTLAERVSILSEERGGGKKFNRKPTDEEFAGFDFSGNVGVITG